MNLFPNQSVGIESERALIKLVKSLANTKSKILQKSTKNSALKQPVGYEKQG